MRRHALTLGVAALATSMAAVMSPIAPAPSAHAVATTVFVDKKTVITERNDAPMKNVTISSTSISRLNTVIDNWIANRDQFAYGGYETLFKMDTAPVRDSNGDFDLDCSSFLQAGLEGITYETSRYTKSTNTSTFGTTMPFVNTRTSTYNQNRRMLADTLAEWSKTHGYFFAARPDFSNIKVGDVLFWHAYPTTDANGAPIWKQVSHAAFVTKVLPDGYFEIADTHEPSSYIDTLISRRVLHATDLHRTQVYSAARFPLDQMWTWGSQTSKDAINLGWTFDSAAGKWTYLKTTTTKATGWQTIDGKKYWFDASGYAQFGNVTVAGVTYLIAETYGVVTQASWDIIQTRYNKYFGTGSGVYDHFTPAQNGWKYIDGAWYYFIPDTGYMVRDGWQSVYEPTIGRSSWNYCKHNGQCIDQLRYEGSNTFMSIAGPKDYARGWYTVDGFTRYFRNTDAASMATGYQLIDGWWYYLRPSSGTRATGWQYTDGTWHWYRPSGTSAIGKQYIDGKWYYFYNYFTGVKTR